MRQDLADDELVAERIFKRECDRLASSVQHRAEILHHQLILIASVEMERLNSAAGIGAKTDFRVGQYTPGLNGASSESQPLEPWKTMCCRRASWVPQ